MIITWTMSNQQLQRPSVTVRALGTLLALCMAVVLSGCSPFAESTGTDTSPAETTLSADPARTQTPAQKLQDKVKVSLSSLAAQIKSPTREQMKQAMITAGALPEKLELSVDITPTGNAVDAIEAATLLETDCIIGQVRDGKVTVTILPILASGYCFVGDVR